MKTKAQRKAARWARKAARRATLNKYSDHHWFRELVASHGLNKARLMAADAEKVNSFAPYKGSNHSSVIIWSETSYWDDWAYTKHLSHI